MRRIPVQIQTPIAGADSVPDSGPRNPLDTAVRPVQAFRPDRVRGSSATVTQASRRGASSVAAGCRPPVTLARTGLALEASLDCRATLLAVGLHWRNGRRQAALPAQGMEPRQAGRQRHAAAVLQLQLLEGVRLVDV